MVFEKYVDFQKICQELIDEDEQTDIFLQRNKKYIHCVDNDIKK